MCKVYTNRPIHSCNVMHVWFGNSPESVQSNTRLYPSRWIYEDCSTIAIV